MRIRMLVLGCVLLSVLLIDGDVGTAELMFGPAVKAWPKRDSVILELRVDHTHAGSFERDGLANFYGC